MNILENVFCVFIEEKFFAPGIVRIGISTLVIPAIAVFSPSENVLRD